jgi:hypothetical protein
MIDHLLRDLQVVQKAVFLIGRIWLNVLVRRLDFFAFAALIAVFGLGMTKVAGFYAFQASLGAVWAAIIVAAVDLVIAASFCSLAAIHALGRPRQRFRSQRHRQHLRCRIDAGYL